MAKIQEQIANARKANIPDQEIFSAIVKSPRYAAGFERARAAGLSNADIAKDLGLTINVNVKMPSIRLTAEGTPYKPFDNTKEARQKREQEALKKQGPAQLWESSLLGLADIGVPFVQAAQYAKDKISQGVNAVAGTNLPTNSYEGVTKTYKDINNNHNTVRKANKQGIDVTRMGANMLLTAPIAGVGGTLKAGVPLASKAGAEFLGKNAALGALVGATGVHENNTQRLKSMGAGALGGAIGAGVGQKVGEGVVKVARKLTPSTASTQNIDIAINVALKNSSDDSIRGMTVTDLSQPARDGLRNEIKKAIKQGKVVDNKTVERMAIFNDLKAKGVDLKPTGKQATGNPKLWTKETELSKMDGGDALNNRYIQQNDTLINALDNALTSTKGTSTNRLQTGESVLNALNTNNSARQQVIKDLYGVAKNHTGNDLALDPNAIVQNARQSMVDNFINPDKAQASLLAKLKPFMDADNPRAFTLKDKELFVKQINAAISKTTDGETRSALGLVRNALEEEADNALNQFGGTLQGEAKNAWQAARGAASQRFKQIERTPSLKAAIDDVAPDQFFEKFILSKSSAVRDVKELVAEVKNNPEAFNNLRLEILRHIADNAVTKQGQAVSPAGMNRALQSIGDDKLKLFFNPEELKHLKNLNAASRYLYSQPMGSNVNNSNTSSALLNMIGYMDVLKRVPIIGPKLDSVSKGVVNSVNAQIKISQGNNAIGKTATKKLPTAAESSLMDQLRKAGFIGGANLQD